MFSPVEYAEPQKGLLSATAGHHWIVEDCEIAHANTLGMDIGAFLKEIPKDVDFEIFIRGVKDSFKGEKLLDKIEPEKDGLILKRAWFSGLFLPQVWEQLPDKIEFLENLCYKAGLSDKDAWKTADIYRFRVQAFKEKEPNGEIL